MTQVEVAVIGGDKRNVHLARILQAKGCNVICYGTPEEESNKKCKVANSLQEAVESADIIVGGIPFQEKNMKEYVKTGQRIFGGVLPQEWKDEVEQLGILCFDFMKEDTIAIYNAIATAEGTILEAIRYKDTNIHKSKSLIIGFGRCAKILAQKLKGLDAEVTISCRKETDLMLAKAFGFHSIPFSNLSEEIQEYEYIYNTVPAVVMKENMIQKMRKDAIIIDIASGKGGVDFEAAKLYQIPAYLCPGLPGKYASYASATILAEYIMKNSR